MKLKSKDIAAMLGVSPATVSLVLNNKPGISEDTRNKVLSILEKNGYDISGLKVSPQDSGKSIQFIVYKKHGKVVSDTPFFSQLIESLNRATRQESFNLVITYINEQTDNIQEVLNSVAQTEPNGLLILATEMTAKDVDLFRSLKLPMLLLDSQFDSQDVDTVCINNSDGVLKAVEHLIALGHTDIGYLHSSIWISNFEKRMLRFQRCMSEHNLPYKEEQVFLLEPTIEGAYGDMQKLISTKKKIPKAFFADNDIIAFSAIRALKDAGYVLPQDISVVGFDDTPYCNLLDPKLTTIRVFKQEMAVAAVERLISRINNPSSCTQKILISTEFVKRESTHPAV